jgi:hypothetical protein
MGKTGEVCTHNAERIAAITNGHTEGATSRYVWSSISNSTQSQSFEFVRNDEPRHVQAKHKCFPGAAGNG